MRDVTFRVLEFDRVLEAAADHALSPASREAVLALRPLADRAAIEDRHAVVADIRRLAAGGEPLRVSAFADIAPVLEAARPEGAILEPPELLALRSVLRVLDAVAAQLADREDLPALVRAAQGITGFPDLSERIERTVDFEGNILDTASFELQDLRQRIRSLERRITRRLEQVVRERDVTPFLQDDFITRRGGRWVIPVRMDAKGRVKGVVHDVSRSGETAFVEPLEIIGLANELENLMAEEKAEIIRILKLITRAVRESAEPLEDQYRVLVALDAQRSVAVLADALAMRNPHMNKEGAVRLVGARHPLLLRHKGDAVVPLDMVLGGPDRVMALTGPNAGGKTIAVKTVGLLALMAQSGMPVPADESSSLPILRDVLADIGDEQSIEADLSTFSAHVRNIAAILGRAGPGSLALLDELGTGTDPAEGAAIGCAVLRGLKERGALVLATTHLTDVVAFVHREEGMANASMEFDARTLTPLYRLRPGEPGESHALEVAVRYGLPEETVSLARRMMGTMRAEFRELLSGLKAEREGHEVARRRVETLRGELEARLREAEERVAAVDDEKREAMRKAYEEAAEIVARVRREAHQALEDVRREKKKAALLRLDETGRRVDEQLRELSPGAVIALEEVEEGGTFFVRSAGVDAEVVAVDRRRGRVRVSARGKELEVPLSQLEPARGKPRRGDGMVTSGDAGPAASRISLVGLRVDEALRRLEPFLNHASLAGLREVVIIHGIGTGALRRAVREHLDAHPLVRTHRGGDMAEGGDGLTVAELR